MTRLTPGEAKKLLSKLKGAKDRVGHILASRDYEGLTEALDELDRLTDMVEYNLPEHRPTVKNDCGLV